LTLGDFRLIEGDSQFAVQQIELEVIHASDGPKGRPERGDLFRAVHARYSERSPLHFVCNLSSKTFEL